MNSEEYEYWCVLAERFQSALKSKKDAAKVVVDAADMEFIIRWVESTL